MRRIQCIGEAIMTYRVIAGKTGEIVADFGGGPDHFELAMRLADDLARRKQHKEQFIVTQTLVVYETPTDGGE
jgi:hypothetical protein